MDEQATPRPVLSTTPPSDALEGLRPHRGELLDNYVTGLLVLLILPLFPIAAELIARRHVDPAELVLAAAIYVIALGFASEWRSVCLGTIIATLLLSASYGTISVTNPATWVNGAIACVAMFAAALWTAFERYERHIVYGRPFFEWELKR